MNIQHVWENGKSVHFFLSYGGRVTLSVNRHRREGNIKTDLDKVVLWSEISWFIVGLLDKFCKYGDDSSGSVKVRNFLTR